MKSRVLLITALAFLLCACAGMVERGGLWLEGDGMELALYQNKDEGIALRELRYPDGTWGIEIEGTAWPGLRLYGTYPGGDGSFHLTRARILSTHINGWNEVVLDISGRGSLSSDFALDRLDHGGFLYIDIIPERIQASSGRIRLRNSRLGGAEALTALRNRRERILSLVAWMQAQPIPEYVSLYDLEDFASYWSPLLFPEPLLRNTIRWNRAYTEELFDEPFAELREVRNSGTLLRDWEEGLFWIYTEYQWEMILSSFNAISLDKIR